MANERTQFRAQTPGDGGGEHPGWAGVGGFGHAKFSQRRKRTAGVQDACKLARCVPHWPFSAPDRARGSG